MASGASLTSQGEVLTGAVATSGTSARGHHLLDGRTGQAAYGLGQATVLAPSLTDADIWATSAFALGRDGAGWVAARPGAVALLVDEAGALHTVRGV